MTPDSELRKAAQALVDWYSGLTIRIAMPALESHIEALKSALAAQEPEPGAGSDEAQGDDLNDIAWIKWAERRIAELVAENERLIEKSNRYRSEREHYHADRDSLESCDRSVGGLGSPQQRWISRGVHVVRYGRQTHRRGKGEVMSEKRVRVETFRTV